MALLERVAMLIRANVNDLLDKAEDPEKLLKQLLLDMQNQYLQLKTQVAVAIADQHLLARKQREQDTQKADWSRRAELALRHGREADAREALLRIVACDDAITQYNRQLDEQTRQVDTLRGALDRLQNKIAQTRTEADAIVAEHRRAKTSQRASAATDGIADRSSAFDRAAGKAANESAWADALHQTTAAQNLEEQLADMERSQRIDRMLRELKDKLHVE